MILISLINPGSLEWTPQLLRGQNRRQEVFGNFESILNRFFSNLEKYKIILWVLLAAKKSFDQEKHKN